MKRRVGMEAEMGMRRREKTTEVMMSWLNRAAEVSCLSIFTYA
jgi:hypothetical protein